MPRPSKNLELHIYKYTQTYIHTWRNVYIYTHTHTHTVTLTHDDISKISNILYILFETISYVAQYTVQ